MDKNRRKFLDLAAGVVISTGLSSIVKGSERELGNGAFLHGVASGDPLQDSVIIWTRITPQNKQSSLRVFFEVSTEVKFLKLVQSGIVTTDKDKDFTIKIDLQGLQAGTQYYYRFKTLNTISQIGSMRTLPLKTDEVTLAVFSCANYTAGYFNAYRDACKFKDKVDVVIHLGDYIYEYGMFDDAGKPAYATKVAKAIGRELPDNNKSELQELTDYRRRYALYRTDPDLQELHQLYPFICIWDDHEIVDNAYTHSVENLSKATALSHQKRREAAIQAYYEWLPIRPPYGEASDKIYRSFEFGQLFSLYMLDTRLLKRSKQVDYADYFDSNGTFNSKGFQKELSSSRQKILGDEQLSWLSDKLKNSATKWQFIAQQVKLSESLIPLEIVSLATRYFKAEDSHKKILSKQIAKSYEETSRIKARMTLKDMSLTAKEKQRLKQLLPYNLDAWDGYPQEREALYEIIKQYGNATIVLSGDAHFSWSSELRDKTNEVIGIELGVTSVSSPGIEEDYDIKDPSLLRQLEDSTKVFDEKSIYSNYSDRGYLIIQINEVETKAYWRYVDTILSRDYKLNNSRNQQLRIALKNGDYFYRSH